MQGRVNVAFQFPLSSGTGKDGHDKKIILGEAFLLPNFGSRFCKQNLNAVLHGSQQTKVEQQVNTCTLPQNPRFNLDDALFTVRMNKAAEMIMNFFRRTLHYHQ